MVVNAGVVRSPLSMQMASRRRLPSTRVSKQRSAMSRHSNLLGSKMRRVEKLKAKTGREARKRGQPGFL